MNEAGVAFSVMDFNNELLMKMIQSLPVCDDTLMILSRIKSTNSRFWHMIRLTMHFDVAYRKIIYSLSLFVPGTRIPCGAETVMPFAVPSDLQDVMEIFESGQILCPNGLLVGGVFRYTSSFYTESLELLASEGEARSFFLCVEMDFDTDDFYQSPQMMPPLPGGMVDLVKFPNVVRSAMGLTKLTALEDEVLSGNIEMYMRCVRVRENTTMQEVFDAITFVEGWKTPTYSVTMFEAGELESNVNTLRMFELADEYVTHSWPVISWPVISWPVIS